MSETPKAARHILLISGGKDSTALAIYMREHHPEIDMEYLFCDTHKELPEIYSYLSRLEAYLGKPIVRLQSELGDRGFDYWLDMYRDYLPSPSMRWCTRKLKIEPFEQYIGEDPVYLYVAIRADENRDGHISSKPTVMPVYPFRDAGLGKEDVFALLENSVVGIPEYYNWRSRSGCTFCFFQRSIEWVGLMEQHPDLFEEAKAYEKVDQGYTWRQNESLEELSRPERVAQIRTEEARRRAQSEARRRPRTLAQSFMGTVAPEEETGCAICHL